MEWTCGSCGTRMTGMVSIMAAENSLTRHQARCAKWQSDQAQPRQRPPARPVPTREANPCP